jgi:hypothetical protein
MTGPLSSGNPVFLLHRSYHAGDEFPALAAEVGRVAGAGTELGVVASLVDHGPTTTSRILGAARGYSIRIAEHELHHHPGHGGTPSRTKFRRATYLATAIPATPDRAYIDTILNAQRRAGANVLLTPTGLVSDTDGERELRAAMRWVTHTRATRPSEPLLVSLTLEQAWLADPKLREVLLNEVVDSREPNWYVRVRWRPFRQLAGQLDDRSVLEGYKHLCQVMESEDKILLLPQTGLAGWLMGAFGARGFSVGTGGPQQAYAHPVVMRRSGTPRPPIPRYFEPSLLHTILADTRRRLATQSGYCACTCAYCAGLVRGHLITNPSLWNPQATHHKVVALARLQSAPAPSGRRAEVRRVVTAANAASAAANPPLRGEDRPLHLGVWEDLLRP